MKQKSPTLPRGRDAWARARESHNPLRGLTLQRAVNLSECYPRGEFADLMWTLGCPWNGIETADADLSTILDQRTAALAEMDHNAKPMEGDTVDPKLAAEQVAAIDELMNGIDCLYDSIEHIAMAFLRGFAHCEIVEGFDGTPVELRPVEQWHVVRDGIRGGWRYNPGAIQTNYRALGKEMDMPRDWFVLREVKRPVGRIALIKYVRANLSETDWGAYTERYGVPSGVVTLPPDVPPEREEEYLAAAEAIAEAGTGGLPHGSKWDANASDKSQGSAPFREHLDYWTEKLVLAGTNGKLNVLAESGSGTLAGSVHKEAFESLSRSDARKVSEAIVSDLVKPYLEKRFPGLPVVATWELAFREEVDGSAVIEDAENLTRAGYLVDPDELSDKTGYRLSLQESPDFSAGDDETGALPPVHPRANPSQGGSGVRSAEIHNRASEGDSEAKSENQQKLTSEDLRPLAELLGPIADEETRAARLNALTETLAGAMSDGFVSGEEGEENDPEKTTEEETES